MKRVFNKVLLIQMTVSLMLAACQSEQRNERTGLEGLSVDESEQIGERIEQIKKVYHLCPSPAEMLSVINVEELDYLGGQLNPAENADLYFDMKSQTLNLGVYITDLAYTALFGRHQETLEYLETVQDLSEQVRVSGAVSDELISRARNNVEFLDSLFTISNEAFINMLFYCEKNRRPNTIVLLSAGAFIESLYLSVNMVGSYRDAQQIIGHLAEQKYAIDNLMEFAGTLKGDESIDSMVEDFRPIKDIYDRLEATGGETTVKKESPSKLVIGGGKKIIMNEQDFNELKEVTLEIRNRITGSSGS